MKAILHFEDDDRKEFIAAIHGPDMVYLLEQIDNKIRECLKYQTTNPQQCLEDIRTDVREMLQKVDRL